MNGNNVREAKSIVSHYMALNGSNRKPKQQQPKQQNKQQPKPQPKQQNKPQQNTKANTKANKGKQPASDNKHAALIPIKDEGCSSSYNENADAGESSSSSSPAANSKNRYSNSLTIPSIEKTPFARPTTFSNISLEDVAITTKELEKSHIIVINESINLGSMSDAIGEVTIYDRNPMQELMTIHTMLSVDTAEMKKKLSKHILTPQNVTFKTLFSFTTKHICVGSRTYTFTIVLEDYQNILHHYDGQITVDGENKSKVLDFKVYKPILHDKVGDLKLPMVSKYFVANFIALYIDKSGYINGNKYPTGFDKTQYDMRVLRILTGIDRGDDGTLPIYEKRYKIKLPHLSYEYIFTAGYDKPRDRHNVLREIVCFKEVTNLMGNKDLIIFLRNVPTYKPVGLDMGYIIPFCSRIHMCGMMRFLNPTYGKFTTYLSQYKDTV
jgi:hypothetical protein